jgi:hypothetical protein
MAKIKRASTNKSGKQVITYITKAQAKKHMSERHVRTNSRKRSVGRTKKRGRSRGHSHSRSRSTATKKAR